MDILITFLVILAYVFGTINGAFVVIKLYFTYKYEGSLEQQIDAIRVKQTVFRTQYNALIFVVCAAFLIAYHLS